MTDAFEGVSFKGVVALVQAIQASSLGTAQQIEKVFKRRAEGYKEVLEFCCRLGLVRKLDASLSVGDDVPAAAASEEFQGQVLWRLLRVRNRYRSDVFRFLRQFEVKNGEASYASPEPRRSREQACRNFLMEVQVIRYRASRREHVLSDEYVSIYAASRHPFTGMTPAKLKQAMQARSALGLAAEVAVLEFERNRVGERYSKQVEHIAATNVAAGYDIKSITLNIGPLPTPRYIEVKAVPGNSLGFYWSRNEVEVAKVFGRNYYLYLVPVGESAGLDLSNLVIIENPHGVVLGSPSDWTVEANVLRCYRERGTY